MKNFVRNTCSLLLKLSLFTAAIAASLNAVVGSPQVIKQSIDDSKLYGNVVEVVFTEAEKNLEGGANGPGGRTGPDLRAAAETAFTPELIKGSTEQFIDSVYRWLNGEVELPDFRIDLTETRRQFIAAVGANAEARVNGLPVCTIEQMRAIDVNADAFSLPCRPPYLSPAAARDQVVTELSSQEDFLKDPVLTAGSLPRNENGKTVFEQIEGAQAGFGILKTLPWALLGLSALWAAGVFFLSESRLKGLKSLGTSFLVTGLFLLIGSWLATYLFDRATQPGGPFRQAAEGEPQEAVVAIIRSVNSSYGGAVLKYALAYGVIGAITLLVLRFTRPKAAPEPVGVIDKAAAVTEKKAGTDLETDKPESKKTV